MNEIYKKLDLEIKKSSLTKTELGKRLNMSAQAFNNKFKRQKSDLEFVKRVYNEIGIDFNITSDTESEKVSLLEKELQRKDMIISLLQEKIEMLQGKFRGIELMLKVA